MTDLTTTQPRTGATGSPNTEETGVAAAVHHAPAELAQVKDQAADRARDLASEARSELRRQADEQTTRVVDGMRRTANQLDVMASASPDPESPVAEAVRQLARASERASDRLETGGIDGVSTEVTRFARQHTGAFLGIAFGVGILAGRFLRSDLEHRRSETTDAAAPTTRDIDLRAGAV